MVNALDISIVIVNYNVKDFLYQCLQSIEKATHKLDIEVFVVDNASSDGSIEFLKPQFPQYTFIQSAVNLGFAKANNLAIRQAKGKYLLILNPDTILAEDTLTTMLAFMDEHSDVGIAGCKVLNADGSFQVQCRRGFPTPWTSFCKLFGLQKLFPHSKLFSRYNQLYRPVDEPCNIDAVIGAFMFCDTKLIQEIGGFDERYFMYGEDLDLCRQVQLHGKTVTYYPKTSIIHFKGESTKRSDLDEIKQQYNAMKLFSEKYFNYGWLFIALLNVGIAFRSMLARIAKHIVPIAFAVSDIAFINLTMMLATKFKFGEYLGFPAYAYPIVFIVVSLIYFVAQTFNGEYFERRVSIPHTFLSLMMSFFILSSLTYFFPAFRFSRGVLLVTIGATILLSVGTRFFYTLYERIIGKRRVRNIIVAGSNDDSIIKMIKHLQNEIHNINILGIVSTKPDIQYEKQTLPYLGNITNIGTIAEKNKTDEVIITDTTLDSQTLMKLMTASNKVKYRVVPEYDELIFARMMDEISGNATENTPNLTKPRYKIIKRLSDVLLSTLCLTLGMLFIVPFGKNKRHTIKELANVWSGKKSMIGLYNTKTTICKEGFMSLASTNHNVQTNPTLIEKSNEYYQNNWTLTLDVEILIKHLFRV